MYKDSSAREGHVMHGNDSPQRKPELRLGVLFFSNHFICEEGMAASEDNENERLDGLPSHATSDEVIARLVVDELYWDSRVDSSKVQVEVTDGVVTLTGHVPTVADRYSAEADARMIHGVVTVKNQIRVDVPEIPPDPELGSNVTAVLAWSPDVDSSDIEVSVIEGVVTLRGTVRSYWEKLRAHLLAAQLKGVVRVVDELVVVPTQSRSDREIADTLAKTLERRLMEDVNSVQITVKNGVVTFRGNVTNAAVRRNVCEIAEHTAGVTGVHNELTLPKA